MNQLIIQQLNDQDQLNYNIQQNKRFTQYIGTVKFPSNLKIGNQTPILNKVQSSQTSFYCGYSNGMILQYNYPIYGNKSENQKQLLSPGELTNNNNNKSLFKKQDNIDPENEITLKQIYYPYQNMDVIDIDKFSKDSLLICTHTQITLLNLVKNKRICLKGHQQTPIAISSHPISPLVVSVSNLIIQHDLRMQKPILVNYITPPVYDIQFFPDGQFYFLSGEPCRVGKDKWMRTLQSGIGTMSMNSKYIVTNDMNNNITFWDWKRSQKLRQIKNISNTQTYQPIHLKTKNQINSQILFLQDNGNLLSHDLIKNQTRREKLINFKNQNEKNQSNWKSQISSEIDFTKHLLLYEHQKAEIRCYRLVQ